MVVVGSAPLPPPPVRHSEAEYRKVERLWKAGKKQIGALTQEQERLLERVRGLEKRAAELEEKVGEGMAAARKAAEAEQENAALRAELDALRRAGFGERLRECLSALRRRAGDGRGNAKR